jgi:predicted GNAT family acetyltransferase
MQVVDHPERNRFEVEEEGSLAELIYEVRGNELVLIHTGVPGAFSGRGIGGLLVEAAIDRAAREGLDIVPVCPFAREWIERHPEALGQVRVAG